MASETVCKPIFSKSRNGYRRITCAICGQVLYSSRASNGAGYRWMKTGMVAAWVEHAREQHQQVVKQSDGSNVISWLMRNGNEQGPPYITSLWEKMQAAILPAS